MTDGAKERPAHYRQLRIDRKKERKQEKGTEIWQRALRKNEERLETDAGQLREHIWFLIHKAIQRDSLARRVWIRASRTDAEQLLVFTFKSFMEAVANIVLIHKPCAKPPHVHISWVTSVLGSRTTSFAQLLTHHWKKHTVALN